MNIYSALGLNIDGIEVISFVGGGGKTTTIYTLAEELKSLGKRVLITTTTKISGDKSGCDYYILENIDKNFSPEYGSISIFGERIKGPKLEGPPLGKLDEIINRNIFDMILIEADGAKQRPIKAMNHHEPVISKYSTKTFGLIGMDCLDQTIEDIVHRPEIFINIVNKDLQEKVEEEDIVKLALHPQGIFKDAVGERFLFLNKIPDENTIIRGNKIRNRLLEKSFQGKVIIGDIQRGEFC